MKTNSYTVTIKSNTIMDTQLSLFGETIKKSINNVTRHFFETEVDYGDIYDEYVDFEVCSLTWN